MLKTLIAVSTAILLTAMPGPSASMQDVPTFAPSPDAVESPPPEYDHAPDQPFVVIVGSPYQVHMACGGAEPPTSMIVMACTFMPQRVILLPHCPPDLDEYCGKLLRHEMAHLNGWRH